MSEPARKSETTVRMFPLGAAAATAEELRGQLAPTCHRIEVSGAIRRRDRFVSCIDLVVIPKIEFNPAGADHNYLWSVLDYFLADNGYTRRGELIRSFTRPLKGGDVEVPINVYSTTPGAWGYEMAYRTGPSGFWFNIYSKLNIAGYTTRDGKVWDIKSGAAVPVPDEWTLFVDLAGTLMREPWQRGAADRLGRSW